MQEFEEGIQEVEEKRQARKRMRTQRKEEEVDSDGKGEEEEEMGEEVEEEVEEAENLTTEGKEERDDEEEVDEGEEVAQAEQGDLAPDELRIQLALCVKNALKSQGYLSALSTTAIALTRDAKSSAEVESILKASWKANGNDSAQNGKSVKKGGNGGGRLEDIFLKNETEINIKGERYSWGDGNRFKLRSAVEILNYVMTCCYCIRSLESCAPGSKESEKAEELLALRANDHDRPSSQGLAGRTPRRVCSRGGGEEGRRYCRPCPGIPFHIHHAAMVAICLTYRLSRTKTNPA